eukprot:g325.t1
MAPDSRFLCLLLILQVKASPPCAKEGVIYKDPEVSDVGPNGAWVLDADQCQNSCETRPSCSYFSFVPSNLPGAGECWLLGKNAKAEERKGVISGPQVCAEAHPTGVPKVPEAFSVFQANPKPRKKRKLQPRQELLRHPRHRPKMTREKMARSLNTPKNSLATITERQTMVAMEIIRLRWTSVETVAHTVLRTGSRMQVEATFVSQATLEACAAKLTGDHSHRMLVRSSAATWQNAVVETCVTGSTVGLLQIAVDETHAKTPPGRRTPGIGAVQGLEVDSSNAEVLTTWLVDRKQPDASWEPRTLTLPKKPLSEQEELLRIQRIWKDKIPAAEIFKIHVVEPLIKDYPGRPSLHVLVESNPLESSDRAPVLMEVKGPSDVGHWRAGFVQTPATLDTMKADTGHLPDGALVTVYDQQLEDGTSKTVMPGDLITIVEPPNAKDAFSSSWTTGHEKEGDISERFTEKMMEWGHKLTVLEKKILKVITDSAPPKQQSNQDGEDSGFKKVLPCVSDSAHQCPQDWASGASGGYFCHSNSGCRAADHGPFPRNALLAKSLWQAVAMWQCLSIVC